MQMRGMSTKHWRRKNSCFPFERQRNGGFARFLAATDRHHRAETCARDGMPPDNRLFCGGRVAAHSEYPELVSMPETLSETRACDLLARLFRARGYTIRRNIMFREYGVVFHIDGWDAKNRIGFEFLTSEDDDHDDLSLEEYKTLMAAQQRGELSLLIMDEVEPLSVADLTATVHEFLDEVAEARLPRPVRKTATKAGKKAAQKKTPTPKQKKKSAKKTRTTKKAVRRR
jgi:hypothetical protein